MALVAVAAIDSVERRHEVRPDERRDEKAGRAEGESVAVIAATVRLKTMPASTPSASAKSAYAGTTIPSTSKPLGPIRPSSWSKGERHHMITRLASSRGDDSPAASSAVFESSQRRRLTPCVQAKR